MRIVYSFMTAIIWLIGCLFVSCSSDNSVEMPEDADEYSVSLDHNLRVLILGNSFSADATAYLDELVTAAKINKNQLGVYNGVINGAGFADWINTYKGNGTVDVNKVTGNIEMVHKQSLSNILKQNWDMIILLQVSNKSYDWESFKVSLPPLLEIVKSECPNPHVRIAYQMPWGHNVNSTPSELRGNVECAKRIMKEFDITHIIPVGIAVQNARNTSLNTDMYLTWDNWHLCYGVGKYVAACTLFESVISPIAHVSVVGNQANHLLSKKETSYEGSVSVDETNRLLCQQCAFYAVRDTFHIAEELMQATQK